MHLGQLTADEEATLLVVPTFADLAEVALAALGRLASKSRSGVAQICGPMSTGGLGSLDANMARFRRAVDVAHGRGVTVFDQLPFQDAMIRIIDWKPEKPYCHAILEEFYRPIFASGHLERLLFIAGWEHSTGAKWERDFGSTLGLRVEEYPMEWLS